MSLTNSAGITGCQIDPYLSPYTKLKSKWIKDLNINLVTLNMVDKKVGSSLENTGKRDNDRNNQ